MKFAKYTLQSGYSYPYLIEPALSALGQCLVAYREKPESSEIISNVMPEIIKWISRNVTNEGYMRGVAIVATGVLSRIRVDLTFVVSSRVFGVFAALLKNQKQSTSVVNILLKGFIDWTIEDRGLDYEDYEAYLDAKEMKVLI